MSKPSVAGERGQGFLMSLARDTRGNTLALAAAATIPLVGMVGGGIDISRMYIVKTRLQHACDAGALAGRKAMGGGTFSQASYMPRTQAERFFDANIASNAFGSTSVVRSYAESSGKVTGTATAVLPMTLMRVFGRTNETLTVTCDAEMRLPNTDIMFVLDTTGSMAQNIPGESTPKINALRTSVKCFFEIVARLDTNATCEGDPPSGGTGEEVQIRFGFVPYSTNVNVGRLLPSGWLADSWFYQSRRPLTKTEYNWVETGRSSSSYRASQASNRNDCTQANAQTFYGQPYQETVSGETKVGTRRDASDVTFNSSTNICSGTLTTLEIRYKRTATEVFDKWRYDRIEQNISGLKNGTGWNQTVSLPIGPNGTMLPLNWDGCIEERPTARTTDFDPIPSDAYDLDLVTTPVSGNRNTLWGPALQGAIFLRQSRSGNSTNTNQWNSTPIETTDEYRNNTNYFCPTAARKLTSYSDPNGAGATDFQNYVDSLNPTGNTYHDIGLLWGARLAWPTGIFRSENEYTDRGGEIDRHIIFMTDGETNALPYDYTAYGLPWFDRRQTNEGSPPTAAQLNEQVNLRFLALCKAIKDNPKGITLWVINFGNDVGSDTKTRLSNCATSPEYFFDASDSDELQKAFRKIADDISQLRLTK